VSDGQAEFDQMLAEDVRPLLREHGFAKQSRTFRRRRADVWHLLNFQKSTSSTRAAVKFTVNVCVASDRLRGVSWLPEGTKPPAERECHVRARIGSLVPERTDLWWRLSTPQDRRAVAAEVHNALLEHAIPFLERFPDSKALAASWHESGGNFYATPGLEPEYADWLAALEAR